MPTLPTTWADVPGAVREILRQPFTKTAEGLVGLSPAADVLGWRAGDINAHWGGPRPVTNLLVGAALGSLGGYGMGRLAEQVLPEKYFTSGSVRKRTAILGGLLGAAPAVYQGFDNVRETDDPTAVFSQWPAKSSADDLFNPIIPRDELNLVILADPNTPLRLKATTAGLVEAADAVGGRSGWFSPWDVARVAVGAGAGLVSGVIAGKALGLLAGLTPDAQRKIQDVGLYGGILKSVIPSALNLR